MQGWDVKVVGRTGVGINGDEVREREDKIMELGSRE